MGDYKSRPSETREDCMKRSRILPGAIFVAAALAGQALSQSIFDEKADAHQQIAAAIGEASKTGKNIILDFGANWCGDCHALEAQMQKPELAALIAKSFVVVNVDVGRFDKNLDLAHKYRIPLEKGIPALAVLDPRGNLLYAQDQGQFEDARHMTSGAIKVFFERWRPKG
jgi:thioredoxin 1